MIERTLFGWAVYSKHKQYDEPPKVFYAGSQADEQMVEILRGAEGIDIVELYTLREIPLTNFEEVLAKALQEPTLPDAISLVCTWENERAVKQAVERPGSGSSGRMWDTVFLFCIRKVMQKWYETRGEDPSRWSITDSAVKGVLDMCDQILGSGNKDLNKDIESLKHALEITYPPYMHCSACNAPRRSPVCLKCGKPTVKPADGWEYPRLPDIALIRSIAKEAGYAIGVHGTLERDLDLIAVPWVEGTLKPTELVENLCKGLNARVLAKEIKPLDRIAVSIQIDGWFKLIDLSIISHRWPI